LEVLLFTYNMESYTLLS